MPFNGSGVFVRLYNWVTDRNAGTKILAARMDGEMDGMVTGLNSVVDGTQGFIGPVRGTEGTAAAPGHSFTADTDIGMYRVSADVLGFSVSGTLELQVEAGYVDAVNGLKIGGTAVTSTATELNILDGVTATTAELNILDGVTATTAELNLLDGVTATTAELNYIDGVTSNIQTQLDAKQAEDATLTALAGLSTGANKIPYSTGTDTFGQLDFVDEDDMASNSATAIPSQQSIKAYVDANTGGGGVTLAGALDYITISGQEITRNPINLTTDVTGDLPVADGGTGSSTAIGARSNLGLSYASAAEIQAGTASRAVTPDALEDACAPETISGASNWTPDWSTFIVATYEVTANRTINNPTNVEPGTTRLVEISGSSSTDRTISWGSNFVGNIPTGTVDDTTTWLVSMTAVTTSKIYVSYIKEAP
jgi:hypothetical protein